MITEAWYALTADKLDRLSDANEWQAQKKAYAMKLIQSIEIEDIDAPAVWIDNRDPRRIIHIYFGHGGKSLEFFISHRNSFHCLKTGADGTSSHVIHNGWPGNAVRQLFGWLYPDNNMWPMGDILGFAGKVG